MEQSIEEFKKKIIENKQSTISLEDVYYFNHLLKIRKEYGSDYKPKKKLTLFGYKEICPNCSKELQTKYFGQKWDEICNRFVQYYIKLCGCEYKYAYTEQTIDSKKGKVPRSIITSFDSENLK